MISVIRSLSEAERHARLQIGRNLDASLTGIGQRKAKTFNTDTGPNMTTSDRQDAKDESGVINSTGLTKIAIKHPAFTLAFISAIGYLLTSGYYSGVAVRLGIPFRPTISTAEYFTTFITLTFLCVIACTGVAISHPVTKYSEGKPWLMLPVGIGIFVLVAALCYWLPNQFTIIVVIFILCGLSLAATRLAMSNRPSTLLRLIGAGLSVLLIYFAVFSVGWYTEGMRTSWLVATLDNQHYVVVGYTEELLVVAPLVSTDPPVYAKRFQRISQGEEGLTVQYAKFAKMDRVAPDTIIIPAALTP